MNVPIGGLATAPMVQLLTADGSRVEHPEYAYRGDRDAVAMLYRDMVLTRRIDTEAFALQRHGELGLWPPLLGQEAAQIGSGRALRPQDYVFPTYREHGVAWCRGIPPIALLGIFRGVEMGGGWNPADHNMALPQIIIGAQTLHATGYAMGLTFDHAVGTGDPDRDAAVIAYFGDGASSQGDVNEALSWSVVHQAPVVFLCQNNQYAISVPLERQTAVPIVQRAAGFGMPGVRVDGNDVLAVHAVTTSALQRARDGQGPTLIEAVTYRMGPHTTSDDPTRYRDADEVEEWKAKDPIARVRRYLQAEGQPPGFFTDVDAEADALGADLRSQCTALPDPDLADLFDHVLSEVPAELEQQRAEYVAWRAAYEGSPA